VTNTLRDLIIKISKDYSKWRDTWFIGILGAVDYVYCEWKNWPIAWKNQFCGGDHVKTMIMLFKMGVTRLMNLSWFLYHIFK